MKRMKQRLMAGLLSMAIASSWCMPVSAAAPCKHKKLDKDTTVTTTTLEATCTTDGEQETTGECLSCHETVTVTAKIKKLGHNYKIQVEDPKKPGKYKSVPNYNSDEYTHWEECVNCGEKKSVSAHSFDKKASCGDLTCTKCGAEGIAHKWGKGKVNKGDEATCTEPGVMTYSCTDKKCDGTATAPIEALGHAFATKWTKDANGHWQACTRKGCTEKQGYELHDYNGIPCEKKASCVVCKNSRKANQHTYELVSWDESGHQYACVAEGCEATMEDSHNFGKVPCGSKDVPCIVEGCEHKADVDHTWGAKPKETKKATCTEGGLLTYTCTVKGCKETKTEDTDPLGHNFSKVGKSAEEHWKICSNKGCKETSEHEAHNYGDIPCDKTAKCVDCGNSRKKGQHAFVWDHADAEGHWYVCAQSSCRETKLESHDFGDAKCEDENVACQTEGCGIVLEKKPHEYGKEKVTRKATCTVDGEKTLTCTVKGCGAKKTEIIEAHGEAIENPDKPALEPTCTKAGKSAEMVCSTCGKVVEKQKTVQKLGHEYQLTFDPIHHWEECTRCGEAKAKAEHKVSNDGMFCSVCECEIEPAAWYEVDKNGHLYLATNIPYPDYEESYGTRVELYCGNQFLTADHNFSVPQDDYIRYDLTYLFVWGYGEEVDITRVDLIPMADDEYLPGVTLEEDLTVRRDEENVQIIKDVTVTDVSDDETRYDVVLENDLVPGAAYLLWFESEDGDNRGYWLWDKDKDGVLSCTTEDPIRDRGTFYVGTGHAELDPDGSARMFYTPKEAGYFFDGKDGHYDVTDVRFEENGKDYGPDLCWEQPEGTWGRDLGYLIEVYNEDNKTWTMGRQTSDTHLVMLYMQDVTTGHYTKVQITTLDYETGKIIGRAKFDIDLTVEAHQDKAPMITLIERPGEINGDGLQGYTVWATGLEPERYYGLSYKVNGTRWSSYDKIMTDWGGSGESERQKVLYLENADELDQMEFFLHAIDDARIKYEWDEETEEESQSVYVSVTVAGGWTKARAVVTLDEFDRVSEYLKDGLLNYMIPEDLEANLTRLDAAKLLASLKGYPLVDGSKVKYNDCKNLTALEKSIIATMEIRNMMGPLNSRQWGVDTELTKGQLGVLIYRSLGGEIKEDWVQETIDAMEKYGIMDAESGFYEAISVESALRYLRNMEEARWMVDDEIIREAERYGLTEYDWDNSPHEPVIRLDLARVLVLLGGYEVYEDGIPEDCEDLSRTDRKVISTAIRHGILKADGGKLRPYATVTRGEAAYALANLLGETDVKFTKKFKDAPVWCADQIHTLYNMDIITSRTEYFWPNDLATLADVFQWAINAKTLNSVTNLRFVESNGMPVLVWDAPKSVKATDDVWYEVYLNGEGVTDTRGTQYNGIAYLEPGSYGDVTVRTTVNGKTLSSTTDPEMELNINHRGDSEGRTYFELSGKMANFLTDHPGGESFSVVVYEETPDKGWYYVQSREIEGDNTHGVWFGEDVYQWIESGKGIYFYREYQDLQIEDNGKYCDIRVRDQEWRNCNVKNPNFDWDFEDGVLTISGKGPMEVWEDKGDIPWREYQDEITKVVIEKGLTSVSKSAFSGCENLTEVVLPDTLTRLGEFTFFDCRSLTEIDLPPKLIAIDESAFFSCENLKQITIPEGITSLEFGVLMNCKSLERLDLPRSLTDLNASALVGCRSLSNIYYAGSPADWSEIRIDEDRDSMPDVTIHCGILPDASGTCGPKAKWELKKGVLTISGSGSFYHWGEPREVDWYLYRGEIETIVIKEGITAIGEHAFYGCSNLTDVTIPNTVTEIDYRAFAKCSSLTEIDLPDSVTEIDGSAFLDCPVTGIVYRGECGYEARYTLKDGVLTISGNGPMDDWDSADDVAWYEQREDIRTVVIETDITGVGYDAFAGCTNLTDVTIPEGVTYLEQRAFRNCTSLTEIALPKSLTSIAVYVFSGCTLSDVYYAGSEEEWQSLCTWIGNGNETLLDAEIHFAVEEPEEPSCPSVTNIRFVAEDGRKLSVVWDVDDAGLDLEYQVEMSKNGGATWVRLPHSGNLCRLDTSMVLSAGIYDKIRVTIRDNTGALEESVTVVDCQVTLMEEAAGQPTLVPGYDADSGTYFIQIHGLEPNGSYMLGHRTANSFGSDSFRTDGNGYGEVSGRTYNPMEQELLVWKCSGAGVNGTFASMVRTVYGDWVYAEEDTPDQPEAWYEMGNDGRLYLMTNVPYPSYTTSYKTITELFVGDQFYGYGYTTSYSPGSNIHYDMTGKMSNEDEPVTITSVRLSAEVDGVEVFATTLEKNLTRVEPTGEAQVIETFTVTENTNGRLDYVIELEKGVEKNVYYSLVFRGDDGHGKRSALSVKNGKLTCNRTPDHFVGSGTFYVVKCTAQVNADGSATLFNTPKGEGYYYDPDAGEEPVSEYAVSNLRIAYERGVYRLIWDEALTEQEVEYRASVRNENGNWEILQETENNNISLDKALNGFYSAVKVETLMDGEVAGETICDTLGMQVNYRYDPSYAQVDFVHEGGSRYTLHVTGLSSDAQRFKVSMRDANEKVRANYSYNAANGSGTMSVTNDQLAEYLENGSYWVQEYSDYVFDGNILSYTVVQRGDWVKWEAGDDTPVYDATGTCGENLTWTLLDGVLTISGSGEMADGSPWWPYAEEITEVVLEPGVTSIGEAAFEYCWALTEVSIPDSVTKIEHDAFIGCESLARIDIPTGAKRIGQRAFAETGLTEVTVPAVVTWGEDAFADCKALTHVTFRDGAVFVPDWFAGCAALTRLTLPGSISAIHDDFADCKNLTDIYYDGPRGDWNTIIFSDEVWREKVTVHCDGEIGDDAPAYDATGTCGVNLTWTLLDGVLTVSGEGAMENYYDGDSPWYEYREEIASIVIEHGVTKIGNRAFQQMENLTNVIIPDSVTDIGTAAFEECSSLRSIDLHDSITKIRNGVFAKTGLEYIKIPTGVTYLSEEMFADCTALQTVEIHGEVTEVGRAAFRGCSSLSGIDLPDSISDIAGEAFSECSSLKEIVLPRKLFAISRETFAGCTSLTRISLSARTIEIGTDAFRGCDSLADVYYGGTEKDWELWMLNESGNAEFFRATVHYGKDSFDPISYGAENIRLTAKGELVWDTCYEEGVAYYVYYRAVGTEEWQYRARAGMDRMSEGDTGAFVIGLDPGEWEFMVESRNEDTDEVLTQVVADVVLTVGDIRMAPIPTVTLLKRDEYIAIVEVSGLMTGWNQIYLIDANGMGIGGDLIWMEPGEDSYRLELDNLWDKDLSEIRIDHWAAATDFDLSDGGMRLYFALVTCEME